MLIPRLVSQTWYNIINGICSAFVNTTFADLVHHRRVITGVMKIKAYNVPAGQFHLIASIIRQTPEPRMPPIGWMRLICFYAGSGRGIVPPQNYISQRVLQLRDNLEYIKLFYAAGIIDTVSILTKAAGFLDHKLSRALLPIVREPWPAHLQYMCIEFAFRVKIDTDTFTLILNRCDIVDHRLIWERYSHMMTGDNLLIWTAHINDGMRRVIYAEGEQFFKAYNRQFAMACAPDYETGLRDCNIWFPKA